MAQYSLGFAYAHGQGVPQDDSAAVHWYRKAAVQGLASAQYALGFSYYKGKGIPKDDAEAVHWYQSASEQGDAKAQHALRLMSRKGPSLLMGCLRFALPLLFVLPAVLVPKRRWGGATWLPWALLSTGAAAQVTDLLRLGPPGVLGGTSVRSLSIAFLGGGSAICALLAIIEALHGSKLRVNKGESLT